MANLHHENIRHASDRRAPAYERAHGLHVLRLAGDDYEMGYQHGSLLKDAIGRGPLPYFERYVDHMLGAGLGPIFGSALGQALRATVGRQIARGFPEPTRRALAGLADGSGIKRSALIGAVTQPETYLWVLHKLLELRRPSLAPRTGVPLMGCTSAVAWGDATADRALYHGRNFDYQGVGAWDTEQAVVFHRPSDGQPYVSIAAAGVLLGGITAMNASGLSLVVHQHMASNALRLGGLPIGVAGDRVMRHAKDLADARRILDEHVPNGCWTYVITSARESALLCYEVTPEARSARVIEAGTFAYSNVFLDPQLGRSEKHLYPAHWRNNLARLASARRALASEQGRIDAETIAAILSDTGENGCRFESAISVLLTVASVVFRPSDGIVWVATGRAPVANNEYVAFELRGERARPDLKKLGSGARDPNAREAFEAYREAYAAYFDRGELGRARQKIERARELQPKEALFAFVAALLALLDRDAPAAEILLDQAIALGHFQPARVAAFHLWRARARDLRGRRDDAVSDYRLASSGDEHVRRAAERGLRKRWRQRRFGIEFTFADVPIP